MKGNKKNVNKEEDLLLEDFSRNVSTKSAALFYGNAFIVSGIPIWLFWRIHQLGLLHLSLLFIIVTAASTWLIAFAYANVKFVLKHKIAQKKDYSLGKMVMKTITDDKQMSKKEKDERVLWKKNEVADYEATTFSIFYNNAMFLMMVIIASCYILRAFTPAVNYTLSVGLSSGLLALLSTGTRKNRA